MSDQIRIILADDHPIVRQGVRQVIERETDLAVVAECGDGAEALVEIEKHQPDVAILDVDMPQVGGFDVLRELNARGSAVKAILLTVHDEPEFFSEALRLGVQSYILKECAVEEIVTAIRRVVAGEKYVSRQLNQYLFRSAIQITVNGLPNLTPTEREILKQIADYKTNREIGGELFISPLTVKTHRRNISLKLGIEGNNSLMKFALENKAIL